MSVVTLVCGVCIVVGKEREKIFFFASSRRKPILEGEDPEGVLRVQPSDEGSGHSHHALQALSTRNQSVAAQPEGDDAHVHLRSLQG